MVHVRHSKCDGAPASKIEKEINEYYFWKILKLFFVALAFLQLSELSTIAFAKYYYGQWVEMLSPCVYFFFTYYLLYFGPDAAEKYFRDRLELNVEPDQ